MESVSIVGIGRMGGALAIALSRAGYEVEGLIYHSVCPNEVAAHISPEPVCLKLDEIKRSNSDILFIATPDQDISGTAALLAGKLRKGSCVFHLSGVLSSNSLAQIADTNQTGSFHPLVSTSDPIAGSGKFAGAYFCIEGSALAGQKAIRIAEALRGHPFFVRTDRKELYHAAAVMASGNFVALVDIAISMLQNCGLEGADADEVLLPLIKSTFENIELGGAKRALTGPFARLDADAFEAHLLSFDGNVSANVRRIYLDLAERSLELAGHEGESAERAAKLRQRILIAKKNIEC